MKRKLTMMLMCMMMAVTALAQSAISGTVISAQDGEPVIGAAVKVKGASQGVVTNALPHYTDFLASFNAGALFEDDDWLVPDADYGAWIHQITADETAANGNYTDIWKKMDYTLDADKIKCSALIVHGLNDFNRGWQEIPHPLQVVG